MFTVVRASRRPLRAAPTRAARRRLFSPAYAYLRTLRCFLRVFSVDIALFFFLGVSASISASSSPLPRFLLLLRFRLYDIPSAFSSTIRGIVAPTSASPVVVVHTPRGPARVLQPPPPSARRVRSPLRRALSTREPRRRARRPFSPLVVPRRVRVRRRVRLPRLSHVTRHHLLQETRTLRPGFVRDARGGDVVVLARESESFFFSSLCQPFDLSACTSSTIARSSSSISSSSPSSGSSRGSSPAARRASANASSAPRSAAPRSPRSSTHPLDRFFVRPTWVYRQAHLRRCLGVSRRATRADTRAWITAEALEDSRWRRRRPSFRICCATGRAL